MSSSFQGRDFGGHRGRFACFCKRVWALVQVEIGVRCGKQRSGVVRWRRSGVDCGE